MVKYMTLGSWVRNPRVTFRRMQIGGHQTRRGSKRGGGHVPCRRSCPPSAPRAAAAAAARLCSSKAPRLHQEAPALGAGARCYDALANRSRLAKRKSERRRSAAMCSLITPHGVLVLLRKRCHWTPCPSKIFLTTRRAYGLPTRKACVRTLSVSARATAHLACVA